MCNAIHPAAYQHKRPASGHPLQYSVPPYTECWLSSDSMSRPRSDRESTTNRPKIDQRSTTSTTDRSRMSSSRWYSTTRTDPFRMSSCGRWPTDLRQTYDSCSRDWLRWPTQDHGRCTTLMPHWIKDDVIGLVGSDLVEAWYTVEHILGAILGRVRRH
jgi:hypothetical protein